MASELDRLLWDAFDGLPVQSIYTRPLPPRHVDISVRLAGKVHEQVLLEHFMDAADRAALLTPPVLLVWGGEA